MLIINDEPSTMNTLLIFYHHSSLKYMKKIGEKDKSKTVLISNEQLTQKL